ncbi:formylglycine-generating enzyme family protein [Bosea sp. Root483D1]|uniref:formylglycine-generating enzyme family protein n=1 Tax=Bosea sp. Root483D1 TaxID=1736544 RepID=UPI000AA5BDE1|nr:formylglycine-generating enzyme family protein [Bosea sp. Root483D1]
MKRTEPNPGCGCGGSLGRGDVADRAPHPIPAGGAGDISTIVAIPGGRAEVGTDAPVFESDGEGPRRFVTTAPFRLDEAAVTNLRFQRFVEATGYVSEAERYGWSFVFSGHLPEGNHDSVRVTGAEWWRKVEGACWRAPEGPGSHLAERMDHPVVHASHRDALAFAAWAGGRLPSETEWEHAARGGLAGTMFPWGDREPDDVDFLPCNIWQGSFPARDTGADGYRGTAPARAFTPNGYRLFQMCGNVWEWSADAFRVRSLKRAARALNMSAVREGRHLLKGGSFLCHRSYCFRYRIAARIGNTSDSSTSHTGFRIAYDIKGAAP